LKGKLKSAQIAYLRIGALLTQVREEQLIRALHHADMEDYAEERLNLGRASLYRYLQVYAWVAECHPQWLQPKPSGFIPELSDAADLMWIERRLASTDLDAPTRATLEALQAKGLAGKLRQHDLDGLRERSQPGSDALKRFLSKLRALRRSGVQVKQVPPEAIAKLDAVIEVVEQTIATRRAADLPRIA
jgi:hypothetical protein